MSSGAALPNPLLISHLTNQIKEIFSKESICVVWVVPPLRGEPPTQRVNSFAEIS